MILRTGVFLILGLFFAQQPAAPPPPPPVITVPPRSAAIEQTTMGSGPAVALVESFDGLGVGFEGPQGSAYLGQPSDN